MVWLALTTLVAALQLVGALEDHGFGNAMLLSLFQIPRLTLETLPFACAIGGAAALQRMEESRELQTMRASGLSLARMSVLAAAGGGLIAVAGLIAGEATLETAESLGRGIKNAPAAKGNVWLHHESSYFHAGRVIPGGGMQDIVIYKPSENGLRVISAKSAWRDEGAWRLEQGSELALTRDGSNRRHFAFFQVHFPLPETALAAIIRRPREMSLVSLWQAAEGLRQAGGSANYGAAWWRRVSALFALPLLAGCALLCVRLHRRVTVAVLTATALSGFYYFISIMFSQIAVLVLAPFLAAVPLILLFAAFFASTRRKFI